MTPIMDGNTAAARHLVVVGPMAVGKTTVATALAGRLGRPLRDSDDDLAAERGTTGRDLAAAEGVAALHRWEADHLLGALAGPTPAVVAPAASTVDDPACRAALEPHVVVVLTAPAEVLAARMAPDDGRRSLGPDTEAAVADLDERRAAAFRAVADVEIDTGTRTPAETVDAVADALAALPGGGAPAPTRVSHVGICVADMDRSLRFYRDGLGFQATHDFSVGPEFGRLMEVDGVRLHSQFLRRDGVSIELLHFAEPGQSGDGSRRPVNRLGFTHLSIRVPDVTAAAARVVQVGGVVLEGTRTTFGGAGDEGVMDFVYCTDPDGTRIELMRLPGPG
jgi:shikimate kinase/catechol 2,3-dioxygenase-like lactoylglutathione lyase family enzyme